MLIGLEPSHNDTINRTLVFIKAPSAPGHCQFWFSYETWSPMLNLQLIELLRN